MDDIKYEIVVYWSDDDDSYIVEVPELPGCMADGKTYEEAITKHTCHHKGMDRNR